MTDLFIEEIKKRVERAANIRSDEFGHDVDALRLWCENELEYFSAEMVPKLLALVELYEKAIRELSSCIDNLHTNPSYSSTAAYCAIGDITNIIDNAFHEGEKIKGGKND